MKQRVLLFSFFYFSFISVCYSATPQFDPSYVKTINEAVSGNYSVALNEAKKTLDPKLIKLVEWLRLTDTKNIPEFEDTQRFIKNNPGWPRIYLIRRNAEKALLKKDDKEALEKWFKQYPPVSTQAVLEYADILMKKKEWEKAVPMLHSLWAKGNLDESETQQVKEKLFFLLDERDYANRTKKLLDERKATQARRFFPFLDENTLKLFQVRADLISNKKNARRNIKSLDHIQKQNDGLFFDLLRWLRVNKKYASAAKLLQEVPEKKQNTSRWWKEKAALIRWFLNNGNYSDAYTIAKNSYMKKGADFADAEWTAGWIALQNLKKPRLAEKHFLTLLDSVSLPMSVSRAQYWLGRTYEEMKKPEKADQYYKQASSKITTIYGQLSAEKLKDKHPLRKLPITEVPDQALMDNFKKSELFTIMTMLENAGQHDLVTLFAVKLFQSVKNPQSAAALAYVLSNDLKRDDLVVILSRRIRQNGTDILSLGYPIWNLEHDEQAETAAILSIIRQESSFSTHAVSVAGARGLMQIMPATAKEMAQKKRKSFSLKKLTNPDFNVELGSAYFAELVKRFNGSYILAIAAYNAGPTNVNRWLNSIGYPYEDIDPIDWIERIPFTETRNYVQRVLENLHIYRRYMNYPSTSLSNWEKAEINEEKNEN